MLKYNNMNSWVDTIWDALQVCHGDDLNPEDREQWDEICTAMAWIAEELGVEVEEN